MINMRLAKERRLSDEDAEAIKSIHEELDEILGSAQIGGYNQSVYTGIEDHECLLQDLWGFPQDPAFHTWKHRYKFKCQWAGRKFRCMGTGVEFTVPNSVEERDYFNFGTSALDVGRLDAYCRIIGAIVEITEGE